MISFFKKKLTSSNHRKNKANQDCTDDPDCPMCHISSDTIEKLQSEPKGSDKK